MATKEIRTQEMSRIYQRDGEIQASVVLEENTPETAPLHDEFTWDDRKAAHEYRLDESRRLIKAVKIKTSPDEPEEFVVHVPKIIKDVDDKNKEGSYKPVSVVVRSQSDLEASLNEMLSHIESVNTKINRLRNKSHENEIPLFVELRASINNTRDIIKMMLDNAT